MTNEFGIEESGQQKEIRLLLIKGLSNAQIARSIGVKEKTVKWHLGRMFKAWGVKTRFALMAKYYDLRHR